MRGWRAKVSGTLRVEGDSRWQDVEGAGVTGLWIERDGRIYSLPEGKSGYFQSKTATAPIGGGTAAIVSRQIGWVEGGLRITLRVMEKDGSAAIEVAPAQENGSAVRGLDASQGKGRPVGPA